MADTSSDKGTVKPTPAPVIEDKSFTDILRGMLGKVVTIVNPESYEDAPVGHQIRVGFYRAKLTGMGNDYMILRTEYVHKGKEVGKVPVQQYIPLLKIKRVSVMKNERLIHL